MDFAQIRLGTARGDFVPAELAERCNAATAAVNAWDAERRALAERLSAIREVPATQFVNGSSINGQTSWIQETTFTDPAAALAELARLQAARIELPLRGLRIVAEVEAARDAVQSAWAAHKDNLDKALVAATATAQKQAAKLPVSDSLRTAHVAEVTATERAATQAQNPTPATFWGWSEQTLRTAKATLLMELREAFAVALKC